MACEVSISVEDPHQGLTEVAAALAKYQVRYALIGGMATSYRSQPRFTKDLDFRRDAEIQRTKAGPTAEARSAFDHNPTNQKPFTFSTTAAFVRV